MRFTTGNYSVIRRTTGWLLNVVPVASLVTFAAYTAAQQALWRNLFVI